MLEKSLGCCHIPTLAEHDIYEIATFVNAAIKIAPYATYFYIGFVNELCTTDFIPSFLPQAVGKVRAESIRPIPYSFVTDGKASNHKHLGDVAIAHPEAVPKADHLKNDVGRQLNKISGGASPLVESLPTVPAYVSLLKGYFPPPTVSALLEKSMQSVRNP